MLGMLCVLSDFGQRSYLQLHAYLSVLLFSIPVCLAGALQNELQSAARTCGMYGFGGRVNAMSGSIQRH